MKQESDQDGVLIEEEMKRKSICLLRIMNCIAEFDRFFFVCRHIQNSNI